MLINRRPEIDRFIERPPADFRAAVIHGRDHGMVRERGAKLAQAVTERPDDPFDTALLREADLQADPSRLEGELQAISMIGGRRLVRLQLTDEGGPHERTAAEALVRHLAGELNPEAFLIIETPALRKDSPLAKGSEKAAHCALIPCYEDEAGDLARLAREALATDGLSLDADALAMFAARLTGDRAVARREIERLALYLGPGSRRQASVADLTDFLGVEPEASLAEAALLAFGGRLGPAQAELRRASQAGEAGVAAVRVFGLHLQRLRRFSLARARTGDVRAAAKATGVFWKQEKEIARQAGAWSQERLSQVQARILAADIACKRAESPARLIAERLMLQVVEEARRLGL